MKRFIPYVLIFAALLTGTGIGFFARPNDSEASADAETSPYAPSARVPDEGEGASLRALRARIADLERQLAAARAEGEEAVSNAVAASALHRGPGEFRRMDPRARLRELEKSDPARYAQITNRIARFHKRQDDRRRARLEFLSSIDTTGMSAEAKKTHDALQELLMRRAELETQLQSADLDETARRALMDELHATGREMRELNKAERNNLLTETAKALGFSGDDVTEITATINDVVSATEGQVMMEPPPDGGRPPEGLPGDSNGRPPMP